MIETAWLIEFSASVSRRRTYYGKTVDGLGVTEENLDAIRFSRKQDAENVIADNGWTECGAVQHSWTDAKPDLLAPTLDDIAAGRILRGHKQGGCVCWYCCLPRTAVNPPGAPCSVCGAPHNDGKMHSIPGNNKELCSHIPGMETSEEPPW